MQLTTLGMVVRPWFQVMDVQGICSLTCGLRSIKFSWTTVDCEYRTPGRHCAFFFIYWGYVDWPIGDLPEADISSLTLITKGVSYRQVVYASLIQFSYSTLYKCLKLITLTNKQYILF